MAPSKASSALRALGLSAEEERLYHRLAPIAGHTVDGVVQLMQTDRAELMEACARLSDLGLVSCAGDRLDVPPLAEAISRLVLRESQLAASAAARLNLLADTVPQLVAATTRPDDGDFAHVQPLDGELSSGGNALELLRTMVRTSQGDMLWLRPDAWAMPRESLVSEFLAEAMATGRRSRAIYPLRALTEAREALQTRARAGEQVRVISELPTRMFILGDSHAVLPEPLGYSDEPRVHVRQRAIVAALTLWFDQLWDRATPVPELDHAGARPDLRRFLLQQLMAGATDEVVARRLGVGLRTVRRRIATMMEELGVDTRFQLGVEAARRGWL